MVQKIKLLAVDDDPVNLQLIAAFLDDEKFAITMAENGEKALDILENDPSFHLVLLDWMMPGIDGLEVLKIIKKKPGLNKIPVIMQTAKSDTEDYIQGINAGAYYYLTKPFEEHMLLSIIDAAVTDYRNYLDLREKISKDESICGLMEEGTFYFRTIDEGETLAHWLALACPVAETAIMGIVELMINAVEHGNLGIGYIEKSKLLERGSWVSEIERRLKLREYRNKRVKVSFKKTDDAISITIKDEGKGFDYNRFMNIEGDRLGDNHGRGILMARMLYFDKINFTGCGNEVEALIFLKNGVPADMQASD